MSMTWVVGETLMAVVHQHVEVADASSAPNKGCTSPHLRQTSCFLSSTTSTKLRALSHTLDDLLDGMASVVGVLNLFQ